MTDGAPRPPTPEQRGPEHLQRPRFARMYADVSVTAERRGGADHRRRLLSGLTGPVVEVGAGNGLNFAHYPAGVTEVVAVEPDDTLRAAAARAAADAPVPVHVVPGHADALPVDDASMDAAIFSLVLCSVPDQATALAEVRRVLAPGGQLRYYEHVRSTGGVRAALEDAVTPVWSHLAGGCHPNRRTGEAVRAAGFVVESEERFGFRPARLSVATAHLLGRAHLPA